MSRRATVLLLMVVMAIGGGASTALAQSGSSAAPPGNSAVDQYRESLPPSSSNSRDLSRRDRDALRRQGRDGRALASALERSGGVPAATAPPTGEERPAAEDDGRGATDRKAARRDGGPDRDDADVPSVGSAADDRPGSGPRSVAPAAASATVGPLPVWTLIVAAVAIVGVGLVLRTRVLR